MIVPTRQGPMAALLRPLTLDAGSFASQANIANRGCGDLDLAIDTFVRVDAGTVVNPLVLGAHLGLRPIAIDAAGRDPGRAFVTKPFRLVTAILFGSTRPPGGNFVRRFRGIVATLEARQSEDRGQPAARMTQAMLDNPIFNHRLQYRLSGNPFVNRGLWAFCVFFFTRFSV
jgi:hypothetical protein